MYTKEWWKIKQGEKKRKFYKKWGINHLTE